MSMLDIFTWHAPILSTKVKCHKEKKTCIKRYLYRFNKNKLTKLIMVLIIPL